MFSTYMYQKHKCSNLYQSKNSSHIINIKINYNKIAKKKSSAIPRYETADSEDGFIA